MSTSSQPPSNPPHRPRWSSEECIRIFVIFPLAICVIGFISSDLLSADSCQHSALRFPERFARDYKRVERELKVYIYRDRDPGRYFQSPRELTGMYGSEDYFFKNIKDSRFLTTDPLLARLFFIPIYWHQMRSLRTPYENMTDIVENYVEGLISKYPYWNKTEGADHFFVICHEKGVEVAEEVPFLENNPIRLVCPPARYTSYKDIALPLVNHSFSHLSYGNEKYMRTTRSLFAGFPNVVKIRPTVELQWENDTELDIHNNRTDTDEGYVLYHDRVHRTKFCICPHGFPDHTNIIADSIRYGCVPVIVSNYENFPFYAILDWHKFSIILAEENVHLLKDTLKGIRRADFTRFQNNLLKVQKHFEWNSPPVRFDAFHMVMYDLWLRHSTSRAKAITKAISFTESDMISV